jgi:hypothetical protein
MKYLLGILSIIFVFSAIGTCAVAKGAVHEIGGLIMLLIGAVLFVGAGVIEALQGLQKSAQRRTSILEQAQEEKDLISQGLARRCPYCTEFMSNNAVKCRACGSPLEKIVPTVR